MWYGFQSCTGRHRSRGEFVRLPEGVEQPYEHLRKHYFVWIFFRLVFMFSECLRVQLVLFSSVVVYRVIPLLLSHYEIFSLSAQEQCCDSRNVAQKRSHCALTALSRPCHVRARLIWVLIGSEIHRQAFASHPLHRHGCHG